LNFGIPRRKLQQMSPLPIPVRLVRYDPEWPSLAQMYSAELSVLGEFLVTVHHIGSTSVPGLAAKPIIDLMPLVTSLEDLDQVKSRVESLGYSLHGEFGIPERRYCARSDKLGNRIVQLHFFAVDSSQVTRHLAFRDFLRAHPKERIAYEIEKQRARALYPDDSHAYTEEKAAWIQSAETRALRWHSSLHSE
jgi:GrpB-like predicted nucleotidyltransferase (UPF0157 family)